MTEQKPEDAEKPTAKVPPPTWLVWLVFLLAIGISAFVSGYFEFGRALSFVFQLFIMGLVMLWSWKKGYYD